ncbi:MAG: hypothetical protein ACC707_07255 [Thiohalomonadales bacterium]
MNTPAHVFINLGILGDRIKPRMALAIILGGLAPDIPAFIFYFYEKVILKTSDSIIWSEKYFQDPWNYIFDIHHSIPLSLAASLLFYQINKKWLAFFFASILVHSLFDLALHHHDAHRHFLPFSDWKYLSPISYWDLRYYGDWVMKVEVVVSLILAVRYLRGLGKDNVKYILHTLLLLYSVNIFMGFYYW